MMNPIQPKDCKILSVTKESGQECTFRVECDMNPEHGQFMQRRLSALLL